METLVEIEGGPKLSADLADMADRLTNARSVYRRQARTLQLAESSLFEGGKYVRTGRLRASLVGTSADSIRKVTATGLQFGTSVPYAQYQTSHIGPETARGGLARSGANMVLKIPDELAAKVVADRGNQIMRGR